MSKQIQKQQAKEEARRKLKELLPPGSTVYTILKHVSRSGMLRVIDMAIVQDDQTTSIPYGLLEDVGFFEYFPIDKNEQGFRATGAGMDMGFDMVYNLSVMIYDKGFACIGYENKPHGQRCPASDHHNEDDQDKTVHKSGGYALRHRWM